MNGDTTLKIDNVEMTEIKGQDVADGKNSNAANFYKANKSTAEGMMDISLLTANANQLKFILSYSQKSKTFYPALALITLSLVLQVTVGIMLIFRVSVILKTCCMGRIEVIQF